MITSRTWSGVDNDELRSFYPHGNLPDFSNKLFASKYTLLKGNEIIGFAGLKIITESYMFFKEGLGRKDKIVALKQMVDRMKAELAHFGLDQCISFTDIPEPVMNHFGFQSSNAPTKVRFVRE
jgi:hypothetical protein